METNFIQIKLIKTLNINIINHHQKNGQNTKTLNIIFHTFLLLSFFLLSFTPSIQVHLLSNLIALFGKILFLIFSPQFILLYHHLYVVKYQGLDL